MAISAIFSKWLCVLVSEKNHFTVMDLEKIERKAIVFTSTIGSKRVNPTKKQPNKKNDSSKLCEENKKKVVQKKY